MNTRDMADMDNSLLNVIKMLWSESESGRLEIRAGETRGALFFKNGKLVDARMGILTGFQAVNAAVSMRYADLSFDRSIPPPRSSFTTVNERLLLKRLLGIDTADPSEPSGDPPNDPLREQTLRPDVPPPTPLVTSPLNEESNADDPAYDPDDTPTIETRPVALPVSSEPDVQTPLESDEVADYHRREKFIYPVVPSAGSPYRLTLVLAVMLILVGLGAVAFLHNSTEKGTEKSLAEAPVLDPPVAEQRPAPTAPKQPAQLSKAKKESQTSVAEQPSSAAKTQANESAPPPAAADKQATPEMAGAILTGKWNVVNTVEQTSYRSFKNLNIGFRLVIKQTGNNFTGKGEKVSENGRPLPAKGRTPISVKGSINRDRVEATFIEEGAARKTNGRFVWKLQKAGLRGTFVSTAAKTRGTSTATKQL